MKWKKILMFIPLISLVGCNHSSEITTKCPLGAPSLVFYDQGSNENFVTINGAAQIIAEFQQDKYDALVVDATAGLKQIKEEHPETNFRFAKLLTSGNLFLASFKHSTLTPQAAEKVLTFGSESSVPYLVSNKLKTSKWNNCSLDSIESGVAELLATAKADLEKDDPENDYYVIAEPALTSLKAAVAAKGKSLVSVKLTDSSMFDGVIPQAALFINKNFYNNKKDKFKKYLSDLNTRIDVCINEPSTFKESLDKYGDEATVSTRFGFKSQIAFKVQENKNNGFAIYPSSSTFDYIAMNKFMSNVGHPEIVYDGSEFIDVK